MSEEQTTLAQTILSVAQAYADKIDGKTLEQIGRDDTFMLMQELVNVYQCMITIATNFDNFLTIYETNQTIINNNFSVFKKQDDALAESLDKSVQSLNKQMTDQTKVLSKQMTNQNKVLDKQVIKLSKSISKIMGGNS